VVSKGKVVLLGVWLLSRKAFLSGILGYDRGEMK
jgi:hypothetical protein